MPVRCPGKRKNRKTGTAARKLRIAARRDIALHREAIQERRVIRNHQPHGENQRQANSHSRITTSSVTRDPDQCYACGVCLTLVFTMWAGDCESRAVPGSLRDGAQYRGGCDPQLSRCRSCFSILALAGASTGIEPSWLAHFQPELSRALRDLSRAQQPAQHVSRFFMLGAVVVYDTHDASVGLLA